MGSLCSLWEMWFNIYTRTTVGARKVLDNDV